VVTKVAPRIREERQGKTRRVASRVLVTDVQVRSTQSDVGRPSRKVASATTTTRRRSRKRAMPFAYGFAVLTLAAHLGFGFAGSVLAEQTRADVVNLQGRLEEVVARNQALRAEVDERTATLRISRWAAGHSMVLGSSLLVLDKQGRPESDGSGDTTSYASVGGTFGSGRT